MEVPNRNVTHQGGTTLAQGGRGKAGTGVEPVPSPKTAKAITSQLLLLIGLCDSKLGESGDVERHLLKMGTLFDKLRNLAWIWKKS